MSVVAIDVDNKETGSTKNISIWDVLLQKNFAYKLDNEGDKCGDQRKIGSKKGLNAKYNEEEIELIWTYMQIRW